MAGSPKGIDVPAPVKTAIGVSVSSAGKSTLIATSSQAQFFRL